MFLYFARGLVRELRPSEGFIGPLAATLFAHSIAHLGMLRIICFSRFCLKFNEILSVTLLGTIFHDSRE